MKLCACHAILTDELTIQFCPLHAAAPDLYDALEKTGAALAVAIRHCVSEEIMPDVGEHVVIKMARAALKKAEGK